MNEHSHPTPPTPSAPAGPVRAPQSGQVRRLLKLGLLGVAMVAMAMGVRALTLPASGEDLVGWRSDLAASSAASIETGKPMLLFFGADWCGACENLRTYVLSQQRVAEVVERDFVPVQVDLTAPDLMQQRLAERYQASAIPLLVVADAEGRPLARHVGTLPADDLLEWLAAARSAHDAGDHALSRALR